LNYNNNNSSLFFIKRLTMSYPSDYSSSQTTQHGGLSSHTQFIFPLLKNGEILQCMSELGIDMQKTELTEPQRHKEKIRKVFWQLLEICCGITEEDLPKQAVSAKDHVAYPEIHDDFTDMLFFQELRQCMTTCGIYDFSWKDLHHPVSKRFRCQLSAIINMAKFREEQLKVYGELNEPRAQLLLTLDEIHKEHEQLSEQLGHIQVESNDKMEEMDHVVRECNDLESEIARSNKMQAAKREEAAALKREANDMKDGLASATWALQETQAEEERLMGQVVGSPERRTQELAKKKERLEKEKRETRQMQENLDQNKTKLVHLNQSIKDVQDTMSLQQQVLEEAEKYEKAMAQVHETDKEVEANEEKTLEICDKSEEAERGLMRVEEKLSHLRRQGKMKMDAAHDRLDISKEQLLLVEKERREGMARVDAGESEVRALEAQMKAEQEKTDKEISELMQEYKERERAFMMRNEKRMQAVEAAM
jgi:kinetochore protein Nuf2